MPGFVLDVSACMPWCCEDEATAESEHLLQLAAENQPLHVPSLWPWEITNALATAVRRQRITPDLAARFLETLDGFDFRIAGPPAIAELPRITELATRHQLTAYDAAYLDLAQRLNLPLATLDAALRKAASAEGVALL